MNKKIRLYSTPICTYCIILKKYLDGKNIEYEEVDITEDEDAKKRMIEKTDQMGVPVLEVDGEKFLTGFDKNEINEALGI